MGTDDSIAEQIGIRVSDAAPLRTPPGERGNHTRGPVGCQDKVLASHPQNPCGTLVFGPPARARDLLEQNVASQTLISWKRAYRLAVHFIAGYTKTNLPR